MKQFNLKNLNFRVKIFFLLILIQIITQTSCRNLQQVQYKRGMTSEDYKRLILFYLPFVAGGYVLCAFIFSFFKVPLRRGHRCRCGERTKWFIKALFYEIFFIFVLFHNFIKIIFTILDLIWPDTKDEDNKLPEEKPEKNKKFIEFKEDK